MIVNAKPVLKDKFWIVEREGVRIGTLSLNDDKYMYSNTAETCYFDNTRQLTKKFGSSIVWGGNDNVPVAVNNPTVYNFPVSVVPFNSMYDVKRKLPLFTKSSKSKSVYCAGYYIIKFDKGWVKSFCPKLITIERYEHRGPMKTDIEMRQEISRANR